MKRELAKRPLVSMCIPVYNEQEQIRGVIENALSQTYRPLEIIVLDNASTDNTWDLCEQWSEEFPEIKLIRNERNLGGWSNFSKGLNVASGEFFCWLAADDRKSTAFIENNVLFLEDNPEFAGVSGMEHFGEETRIFDYSGATRIERIEQFRENCWQSHGLIYGLYRTCILQSIPGLKEVFAVDWSVLLWALSIGKIGRNLAVSMVISPEGNSNSIERYSSLRKSWRLWIRPLSNLEREVLGWKVWSSKEKRALKLSFAKLNLQATFGRLKFEGRRRLQRV